MPADMCTSVKLPNRAKAVALVGLAMLAVGCRPSATTPETVMPSVHATHAEPTKAAHKAPEGLKFADSWLLKWGASEKEAGEYFRRKTYEGCLASDMYTDHRNRNCVWFSALAPCNFTSPPAGYDWCEL